MVSIRIHVVSELIPQDDRLPSSSLHPLHEKLFQFFAEHQLHVCTGLYVQLSSADILIAHVENPFGNNDTLIHRYDVKSSRCEMFAQ